MMKSKILLGILVVFCLLIVLSCEDENSTKPKLIENLEFSIAPGVFNNVVYLEITCPTEGAEIYYTKDESQPTESSRLYDGPIELLRTTTIKAKAFKHNYESSTILSGKYWVVLAEVETPTFTPLPGDFSEEQVVTLSCSTEDSQIYYTLDDSEPTDSSLVYTSPILIDSSSIIKARAYKEHFPTSEIVEGEFIITTPSVAIPSFSPSPGEYDLAQTITLQCYTPEASIYYTIDGSQPTTESQLYTTPLDISSTTTVKAFATKEELLPSVITSGQYLINYQSVSPPQFSPEPGDYYGNQTISLSIATPGATIHYTLDGSEPSETSPIYNDTIEITTKTTIKAQGFKTNLIPSQITVGNYNLFNQIVASPEFGLPPGEYIGDQELTITSSTPGATIYYTLDGREPTESSNLYNAPLVLTQATTIKARAFAYDYYPSEIVEGRYLIGEPITSDFVFVEGGTFNNGTADVTLSNFYMSKFEVMQVQYQIVMGTNPSNGSGTGPTYPVYNVSWYNAVMFCNALSLVHGLTPCYSTTDWSCDFEANGYRLPTEMEWMYAAKGGNLQPASGYNQYSGTDLNSELTDYAWYLGNNNPWGTKEVGTKNPNQLGLNDMSGNVFEWCWDFHASYSNEAQTNPAGPNTGSTRIIRGGDYGNDHLACKVAYRHDVHPQATYGNVGFRLVRRLPD